MERYKIDLFQVEEKYPDERTVWQADCGEAHARGDTVGEAVERLVAYVRHIKRQTQAK